jgi:hypothetical protein
LTARQLGTAAVHAALTSIVSLPEDTLVEANDDAPAEEQTASSAGMSAAIVSGQLTFQERYPMLRYNAL